MNYIGSKLSLLNFLEKSINQVAGKDYSVFCDFFAGTGAVGLHFKKQGHQVYANDVQYYSYVLNRHYIGNHRELAFKGLVDEVADLKKVDVEQRKNFVCDYLNGLKGVSGFIFKNYCLGGTQGQHYQRQYFSDENGQRCDAIRMKIENWKEQRKITDDEYYFLLTSLLESVDKQANTASVYGAFLKKLKQSAQKLFVLKPAQLVINEQSHKVFNEDINNLAGKIQGDVLYLDPPYNHRQYATNYHLLETIAKYDNPQIHGKTGLRNYESQKSLYCSRSKVKQAFKDLILKAKVKYIFLSYNNEGLMTPADVKEIMSLRGKYGVFTQEYGRFKADTDQKRDYKAKKTLEYLHYVICS
jgi:adenine-specific DNA-methyltransferase